MPRVVKQPDITQTILDLQKRITKLENAPRLTASNIQTNGNSRLSVSNVGGHIIFQAGDLAGSVPGSVVSGMAVYRPNGIAALTAASGGSVQYGFNDNTGSAILQTNESSGYGLEDPSIPICFYANNPAAFPSTASGTPSLLWLTSLNASHSLVDVTFQAAVSGGATGQVTLQINGITVGTKTVTGASFIGQTFSAVAITGATNTKTQFNINLFGAITAGAGTLQVVPVYARLRGSLG